MLNIPLVHVVEVQDFRLFWISSTYFEQKLIWVLYLYKYEFINVFIYLKDLKNIEASNGKIRRRMEVYRVDKDLWMCRMRASQMQLAEVQSEIAHLVNDFDFSLENSSLSTQTFTFIVFSFRIIQFLKRIWSKKIQSWRTLKWCWILTIQQKC